jgi:hypothetical protein
MKMYGGVEVQHHIFFTQMEVSGELHPQGESLRYKGGWIPELVWTL